ncbi:uncharacterized protein LOC121326664 [Polyodon spathula]|uniref:uncharacterized protein LOC121326664 n=1 Tax=Polyodon spathula TaxID=7913 RepID=UPI001B7EF28F|nr:uncharacterized protein LOC121326664 [Polyodon spathula]
MGIRQAVAYCLLFVFQVSASTVDAGDNNFPATPDTISDPIDVPEIASDVHQEEKGAQKCKHSLQKRADYYDTSLNGNEPIDIDREPTRTPCQIFPITNNPPPTTTTITTKTTPKIPPTHPVYPKDQQVQNRPYNPFGGEIIPHVPVYGAFTYDTNGRFIVPTIGLVPYNGVIPSNRLAPDNGFIPVNRRVPANGFIPKNGGVITVGSFPRNGIIPTNRLVPINSIAPKNGLVPTKTQVLPNIFVSTNGLYPRNGLVPNGPGLAYPMRSFGWGFASESSEEYKRGKRETHPQDDNAISDGETGILFSLHYKAQNILSRKAADIKPDTQETVNINSTAKVLHSEMPTATNTDMNDISVGYSSLSTYLSEIKEKAEHNQLTKSTLSVQ